MFFITGTDTGVGKTIITAGLTLTLRKLGYDVGVMKPVSTGDRTDAEFLIKAVGLDDPIDLVNPIHFKHPLAPTIAAKLEHPALCSAKSGTSLRLRKAIPLGQAPDTKKIFTAYRKLKARHKDGVLVEGIGGILVPLTKDYLVIDLIKELHLPLIIVTRPDLGTINHTLMTIEAARQRRIKIAGFIINHSQPGRVSRLKETIETIERIGRVPCLGAIPYLKNRTQINADLQDFISVICANLRPHLLKSVAHSGSRCIKKNPLSVPVGVVNVKSPTSRPL
ncbi:MAG: dethiobiotin synthase [Planctomycetes bacterium]|nr:dethiobiotin synthase [Planctomycetota bacterium]